MASSALLRRWTAAQIFRSGAFSNSSYSPLIGNSLAAANRMVTTAIGGVSSPKSPAVPWLMMKPSFSMYTTDFFWRFYCFAHNKVFSFLPKESCPEPYPQLHTNALELVGSSRGWLASYHKQDRDLFLVDPISNQKLKLPPLIETMRGGKIHSVVLSDSESNEREGEGKGKAFVTFGSGHSLALCSLGDSHGWTLFGGGDYESVVHSSRYRRLFCITSALKLEAWDVEGETPTLDNDWTAYLEYEISARPGLTRRLNYVVCEEQSGEVYAVVRHVNPEGGSWVERGVVEEYVSPTVDFEVYKMDRERGRLVEMKDSLEGLTMFVGINDAIAVRGGGGGVKPDSIYFGFDGRLRPTDGGSYEDRLDSFYNYGVFDYRKGGLCRRKTGYQVEHDDPGSVPVWFTPRRFRRI